MAARAADNGERWRMPPAGRVLLRRRADQTRAHAAQLVLELLDGTSHREAQARLGLRTTEYARVKRLLTTARAVARGSSVPMTLAEALAEAADLYVVRAIRLAELRQAGFADREARERLGCSMDEFEAADEWGRDVRAELARDRVSEDPADLTEMRVSVDSPAA